MGYYAAGDYYGSGDYYAAGGFNPFKSIAKAVKGVAGFVGGLGIPGVSSAAKLISHVIPGGRKQVVSGGVTSGQTQQAAGAPIGPNITLQPFPSGGGIRVDPLAFLPGGAPMIAPVAGHQGMAGARRRQMNPTNVKALRRAIRREQRFVAVAKRALKGTGLSISRRQFGKTSKRRSCR